MSENILPLSHSEPDVDSESSSSCNVSSIEMALESQSDQSVMNAESMNMAKTIKQFLATEYTKYFDVHDKSSCKVKCKVLTTKKGRIGTIPCDGEFKLQKGTYVNLKRHLEHMHQLKNLTKANTESTLKQPTLTEFNESKTKYPASHPKQQRFVRDVIFCFAVDGIPFETVDKVGFQQMVLHLDPRIDVKYRTFFMRELDNVVQTRILPQLRDELKSIEKRFCHFSCDVWTSRQGEGVFCILAHFVDNMWNLQKRVIHYRVLEESHTGDYIRGKFLKCLAEFGVPSNWGGIVVTDNASNLKNAFNLENILHDVNWVRLWRFNDILDADEEEDTNTYEDEVNDPEFLSTLLNEFSSGLYNPMTDLPIHGHLTCVAHTLQLAINDAIKTDNETVDLLKYINKVMVFFKRSTKWRDELRKMCNLSPKSYVPTRWNSYLCMIERFETDDFFSGIRSVLDRAALDRSSRSPPEAPGVAFRPKAKELSNLLMPLGEATNKLQSDVCTSNLLILTIVTAFKKIAATTTVDYCELQQKLLTNLKARMEPIMSRKEYILAALLDPRIKANVFKLTWSEENRLVLISEEDAISMLREAYHDWSDNGNEGVDMNQVSQQAFDVITDEDPFFRILTEASSNNQTNEVEQYLSEPLSPASSCPLSFWQCNSNRFKVLSNIARKYLAIPASSAGVERVFSVSGWLSRARRASIKSENIAKLLLVRENFQPDQVRSTKKRKYFE